MTKAEKIKYLLAPAIGFGLGGALWGLFHIIKPIEDANLFGAAFIGLIGTSSLVLFWEKIRILKKILVILGGIIVWLIIFYILDIVFLFGSVIFPPAIIVSVLLSGIIISLFYALILKSKIWSLLWRGEVGFILALAVGSILVNLIGDIFSFALTGIILGLALGWGLYKGQKPK